MESRSERGQQPHPAQRLLGCREQALGQELATVSRDLGADCQHCEQSFVLVLLSAPESLRQL